MTSGNDRQKDGWARDQVTIRLTPARKRRLRTLARSEGLLGGPAQALDRAVELALSEGPSALCQRIEELELAAREAEERRSADAAKTAAALARVAASLDGLQAALAQLAGEE